MKYISFILLLAACHAGGGPQIDDSNHQSVVCAHELDDAIGSTTIYPEFLFSDDDLEVPPVLNLTPDSELVQALQNTVTLYRDRLGLDIVFTNTGIPVELWDYIPYGDTIVDGLAHYDNICAFQECNVNHGVYIAIAEDLLSDKRWALQHTSNHEVGHIISGWGVRQKRSMHLPAMTGLMSPGCVNHLCAEFSMGDAALMCEVAPCKKVEL